MALPPHEELRIVQAVTGRDRASVTVDPPDAEERSRIESLVARREAGVPLQYLEGTAEFGPIELAVDERALVPRPETEQLWEEAVGSLRSAGPGTVIVDLGTGGGNLALALKHAFPRARVFGVDISEAALSLARENSERTGLEVEFLAGDLFGALPDQLMGRIDLVVSNPPYVAEREWGDLPEDVKHEPRGALVSGPTGLEALERIADDGFWWVGIGGWVLCEIGETQGPAVAEMFGAFDREIRPDLSGRDRFLVARKGAPCCV